MLYKASLSVIKYMKLSLENGIFAKAGALKIKKIRKI